MSKLFGSHRSWFNFVVDKETNRIVRIFKQYKRACNMMNKNNLHVLSYNPEVFPMVKDLKVGDIINEREIERTLFR